ncbi:hypothetical protein [Flavisolibacter tropicus]|uniref:Uncharacterized protein n=1 Tax=Flavisolibacter tropicus TaxID=1492898 RepID=A0A172TZU6_9BACT|nr:hypothetical protein [Flavisolibacter tropicus]ANE52629.1 hypothetical protein SY85_21245 [Flavisolibacter tropicus]
MKMRVLLFFGLVSIQLNAQTTNISITQSFSEYAKNPAAINASNRMIAFSQKENTQGSPYLVNGWAKGSIVLRNSTMEEPTFVLNYDKVKENLIVKLNDQNVLDVDMGEIVSFMLNDSANRTYKFVKLPGDHKKYLEELYKGNAYSLYKEVNTKFYKSDYENKGLYEKGYKYDRYEDEFIYYIADKKNNLRAINNFSKKAIKRLSETLPISKELLEEYKPTADKEDFLIRLTKELNATL